MENVLVNLEPLILESEFYSYLHTCTYICSCYTCACLFTFRLDIPTMSPVKVVKFHEVDESFGLDLLQELARAYTASSNTRMQVIEIASF